jgi:hypothetical protein
MQTKYLKNTFKCIIYQTSTILVNTKAHINSCDRLNYRFIVTTSYKVHIDTCIYTKHNKHVELFYFCFKEIQILNFQINNIISF